MARGNPHLLGVDVRDALQKGAGVFITSAATKNLVRPLIDGVYRPAGRATEKAVDTVATLVTALAAGQVVSIFNRDLGADVAAGGVVLAAAKAYSVPLAGVEVDARFPLLDRVRLPGGAIAASNGNGRALPAASAAVAHSAPAPVRQTSGL